MSSTLAPGTELVRKTRNLLAAAGVDMSDERLLRAILSQPCDLFSPLANASAASSTPGAATLGSTASSTTEGLTPSTCAEEESPGLRDYLAEAVRQRKYEPPPAQALTPDDIAAKARPPFGEAKCFAAGQGRA
ncbi:hypothetical protein AURDEDRAFT_121901 [Auricularia subglabra TFB-10046 SS5]|nr:hypothetical protein AURDEDRAFT_121901 [Auricularia subglabra TFB-10046 SS5]